MEQQFKIILISPAGIREVTPVSWDDITEEYSPLDDFRNGYSHEVRGDLKFKGDDLRYFLNLEHSARKYDDIRATIYRRLPDGSWALKMEGYMNLRDAQFDLDEDYISIDFLIDDPYADYDDRADEEVNIFTIAPIKLGALSTPRMGGKRFNNGRRVYDVLLGMLRRIDPGMSLKSDFFQWNAADTAYTIGHSAQLHDLAIFASGDIILEPDSSATVQMMALSDLVRDLCSLCNLQYRIENHNFRIEHISWWNNRPVAIDVTTGVHTGRTGGQKQYGYMNSKLYRYERYTNPYSYTADFFGALIEYDNSFLRSLKLPVIDNATMGVRKRDIKDLEQQQKERTIKKYEVKMATDIESVAILPDDDVEYRTTPVLVAFGANGVIESTDRILDPAHDRANNVLSWAVLHEQLHVYGRIFPSGRMNNADKDFTTTIPIIQQDEFWFDTNSEPVDLDRKIRTRLGDGIIQNLTIDVYTGRAYVDLLHVSWIDNPLSAPVAVMDVYSIKKDTLLDTIAEGMPDLTANDTGATRAYEEQKSTRAGGHVRIYPTGNFIYTPPPGYEGTDTFTYAALNAAGNADSAMCYIVVRSTNIYVRKRVFGSVVDGESYKDIYAYFYSDPAGTIPISLWGAGIDIKFRRRISGVVGPVESATPITSYVTLMQADTVTGNFGDDIILEADPNYQTI